MINFKSLLTTFEESIVFLGSLGCSKNGLKFKTSGMVKWKGYVYIKYDEGSDLYNIDFFRMRGVDIKYDKQVEGVFAEDLVDFINAQVG
jgi:hypothetical protein